MRCHLDWILILAFAVTGLFAAGSLRASESEEAAASREETSPSYAKSALTGNWGGARDRLAKEGLVGDGHIRYDLLRNRGGASNGTRGVSHLDLKLMADLEVLWGWKGGSATVNVLNDAGAGVNARHTGSLMGVTNIEVPFPNTTRLFQAWLQKSFFDERLAILVGLYPIDSEFFGLDSAAVFLGPQYGTPGDLALTRGPSIFNNSAFGLRTKLQSVDKSLYAMWALLDGIPNDPAHPKRTAIRFDKGDGAFNIAEVGWLPEAATAKYEGHAKAAVGVWGYTSRVESLVDVDAAGSPVLRRSWGGYVLGERTLFRFESERYLSGFVRYTWTDGNSTAIKNTTNLGLHLHGPLASRPDDVLGLAFSRARLSDKWRSVQTLATASTEKSLELTYRYALTPYFAIQPVAQRIWNPGGGSATPTASLLGLRLELTLWPSSR